MIIKNIIRVLSTNEEVCLNKLGTFRSIRKEASLKGNQIFPPENIIVFEEDQEINGFFFVTRISQWEQISILDANEKTKQWVNELLLAIEHNESVTYDNLGTFYRGTKGEILFKSAHLNELNTEYEGMPILSLHDNIPSIVLDENVAVNEIAEETPNEVLDEVKNEEPVENELVENVESDDLKEEEIKEEVEAKDIEGAHSESVGVEESVEIDGDVENQITEEENNLDIEQENEEVESVEDDIEAMPQKKKSKFWGIAVFVLVIVGALAILVFLFKDDLKNIYTTKAQKPNLAESHSKIEEETIPIQMDTTSTDALVDTLNEELLSAEDVDIKDVVSDSPVKTTAIKKIPIIHFEQGKFYVIAGSFTKESDAELHIRQKQLERFNPQLVKQSGNNRLRVCIGIFTNETDAVNFAASIDKNYWVLK